MAEGRASCYDEAETAASLLALNFGDEEALHAAKECGSVDAALAYLQQECELCTGRFSMNQVIENKIAVGETGIVIRLLFPDGIDAEVHSPLLH